MHSALLHGPLRVPAWFGAGVKLDDAALYGCWVYLRWFGSKLHRIHAPVRLDTYRPVAPVGPRVHAVALPRGFSSSVPFCVYTPACMVQFP